MPVLIWAKPYFAVSRLFRSMAGEQLLGIGWRGDMADILETVILVLTDEHLMHILHEISETSCRP